MHSTNRRTISAQEAEIIARLLAIDFPGVEKLRQQTINLYVADTGDIDNWGSIYLFPTHDKALIAEVISQVPVEALFEDSDGESGQIFLHVINGYLHELEIIKHEDIDLVSPIDPSNLKVTPYTEDMRG